MSDVQVIGTPGPTPEQIAEKTQFHLRQEAGNKLLAEVAARSNIKDATYTDICALLILKVGELEKQIAILKGDRPLIISPH